MKPFLSKAIFFALILSAIFMFLGRFANGKTDAFYLRFTTPKQKNLILGTSKAAQGIQPAILQNYFEEPFSNYAFNLNHSPWGEVYYKSIQKKHSKQNNGVHILAIDGWSLSNWQIGELSGANREDEGPLSGFHFVDQHPNYYYLLQYTTFLDILNPPRHNINLHEDGWLEIYDIPLDSVSVTQRTTKKVSTYSGMANTATLSTSRSLFLLKTINYLKQYGEVFLVRLPVSEQLYSIEQESFPEFESMIQSSIQASDGYLDLSKMNSELNYSDGNHLTPSLVYLSHKKSPIGF